MRSWFYTTCLSNCPSYYQYFALSVYFVLLMSISVSLSIRHNICLYIELGTCIYMLLFLCTYLRQLSYILTYANVCLSFMLYVSFIYLVFDASLWVLYIFFSLCCCINLRFGKKKSKPRKIWRVTTMKKRFFSSKNLILFSLSCSHAVWPGDSSPILLPNLPKM